MCGCGIKTRKIIMNVRRLRNIQNRKQNINQEKPNQEKPKNPPQPKRNNFKKLNSNLISSSKLKSR